MHFSEPSFMSMLLKLVIAFYVCIVEPSFMFMFLIQLVLTCVSYVDGCLFADVIG